MIACVIKDKTREEYLRSSGMMGDATARCPSVTLFQRPKVQGFTTLQIDQPGTHITKDVEKSFGGQRMAAGPHLPLASHKRPAMQGFPCSASGISNRFEYTVSV